MSLNRICGDEMNGSTRIRHKLYIPGSIGRTIDISSQSRSGNYATTGIAPCPRLFFPEARNDSHKINNPCLQLPLIGITACKSLRTPRYVTRYGPFAVDLYNSTISHLRIPTAHDSCVHTILCSSAVVQNVDTRKRVFR
jgi:hypothetical protein